MENNVWLLLFSIATAFVASTVIFKLSKQYLKISIAVLVTSAAVLWGFNVLDLNAEEIGFRSPDTGIIYGVLSALVVGGAIFIGSRIKLTSGLFEDSRTRQISTKQLLNKTLIDIPIGTVIFEEILFRGVLYGYISQEFGAAQAILWTSVLFGLWHILPAITFATTNEKAKGSRAGTIIGTIIFTTFSGVIFGLLRYMSGSVLAPILLHYAVNTSSFLASWYNSLEKQDA